MTEKSLFDLSSLVYCGEGRRTIVVSNTLWGWILRIRKTVTDSEDEFEPDQLPCADLVSTSLRISRYFGTRFTRPMRLVQTTPEFLQSLERRIDPYRPSYRKIKGVDYSQLYVVVAPDAAIPPAHLSIYTQGPTISVEIKPKFGVFTLWPSTGLVNQVKTSASLFCLRQNHATKLARWQQPSLYCPCDLFSGNPSRMIRSLRALLRTPQINLRIHLDGHLIFSHEVDRLTEGLARFFGDDLPNQDIRSCESDSLEPCDPTRCSFIDNRDRLIRGLLLDSLLYDLDPTANRTSATSVCRGESVSLCFDCQLHGCPSDNAEKKLSDFTTTPSLPVIDSSSPFPPDGSILGRVLATQLLSRVDICFVVPHYERVCQHLKNAGVSWSQYLQMSLKCRALFLSDDAQLAESFDVVERYLIALVARDCSIMLSLRRATNACPDWVPTVGGNCSCLPRMVLNAVVVDLDPKCLSKISGRCCIEQAIAKQAFQRHPDLVE